MRIGNEASNQISSNTSATAVSRHNQLLWTKKNILYKGCYEFKTYGSLSFFGNGLTKTNYSHSGKIPKLKEELTRSL